MDVAWKMGLGSNIYNPKYFLTHVDVISFVENVEAKHA